MAGNLERVAGAIDFQTLRSIGKIIVLIRHNIASIHEDFINQVWFGVDRKGGIGILIIRLGIGNLPAWSLKHVTKAHLLRPLNKVVSQIIIPSQTFEVIIVPPTM